MKKLLVVLSLGLLPLLSTAQHGELGLIIGASVYQGDLTPSRIWSSIGQTHISYGAFYRQNLHKFFALKFAITQGTISGDDATARSEGRKARNLSFKSPVTELALTAEINVLGYQPYNLEKVFSPYAFGGIALYRFNPKAKLDGKWYELHPLGTEGQYFPETGKSPYKLIQFSIPMGMGFKYALNDIWNIGIEMGSRMTFTDYLDDVSTTYVADNKWLESGQEIAAQLANRSSSVKNGGELRGNARNNDWYIFGGITLSYNFLDNGLVGARRRGRRSKTGCPTF